MQHFAHITREEKEKIFYKQPGEFDKHTKQELLGYALGATLYIPAVHPKLLNYLLEKKYTSLTSLVICLEDGIADCQVEAAEQNLTKVFNGLKEAISKEAFKEKDLPLLFIRTRSTQQLKKILGKPEILEYITGFSLPKFNSMEAEQQLQLIKNSGEEHGQKLYAMPILETEAIIDLQTSLTELQRLKEIIDGYRDIILNIRIGATDFSSIYGIRRNIDSTIYDIHVIRECMTRIINVFGKARDGYVISGPVWEFFSSTGRLLKPELRQTPFKRYGIEGSRHRKIILDKAEDGLIKEIILDKVNGLCGKTIIHPTHIAYVNALQAVTREEYEDALQILGETENGVVRSRQSNKMNEIKPHTSWAEKILKRAEIYGVMNEDEDYTELF